MKQNIPQIEGELFKMRSPSFPRQLSLSCFCSDVRAQASMLRHRFERRAEDCRLITKFHFCLKANILRTVTEDLALSLGWVSFRMYSAWYPVCVTFQLNFCLVVGHLSWGSHHHLLFFQVGVGQLLFFHLIWWLVLSTYWVPLNKVLNPCWTGSEAVFCSFSHAAASRSCNGFTVMSELCDYQACSLEECIVHIRIARVRWPRQVERAELGHSGWI